MKVLHIWSRWRIFIKKMLRIFKKVFVAKKMGIVLGWFESESVGFSKKRKLERIGMEKKAFYFRRIGKFFFLIESITDNRAMYMREMNSYLMHTTCFGECLYDRIGKMKFFAIGRKEKFILCQGFS